MESKAFLKFVRITPRKARRVIDLIRGKTASEALILLRFTPYRGAKPIEKVLRSAMANAEQINAKIDIDKLRIKEALVDQGPVMRRTDTRAMGRANIIKKRTSHIKIILAEE